LRSWLCRRLRFSPDRSGPAANLTVAATRPETASTRAAGYLPARRLGRGRMSVAVGRQQGRPVQDPTDRRELGVGHEGVDHKLVALRTDRVIATFGEFGNGDTEEWGGRMMLPV